ncbi:MAG: M28 family peptidase [Terriglobia bacterium]
MKRFPTTIVFLAAITLSAGRTESVAPREQAALDHITADALRGDLSFLASDALEGRATPSRGLDLAAEFIASHFRRAGLEPIGPEGSYFQWAKFVEVTPNLSDLKLTLTADREDLELTASDVRVHAIGALDITKQPVTILSGTTANIEGRIVAGEARRYGSEAAINRLQAHHPALILLVAEHGEPQEPTYLEDVEAGFAPVLTVINADAVSAVSEKRSLSLSVHLSAPVTKEASLRNVAGILRGSDPALRNQYVIVSAHYDHLGRDADQLVFNGANDNGSGTVSVLELASALATLPVHPARSILFLTVFGEEEGLLGAYFYARHPLVPVKDTVADINLEMMGRTDDPAGAKVGAISMTGMAFSDLPSTMTAAARAEGVSVYTRPNEAEFFSRSDNYAFALAGIVAHTVLVAFDYPDYHAVGDKWQKIDYANMAKVDKAVGAGILDIANAPARPKWSNAKEAALYRDGGK